MLAVLLYRALTFYLRISMGLVYLPIVGGLREVLDRRRDPTAAT